MSKKFLASIIQAFFFFFKGAAILNCAATLPAVLPFSLLPKWRPPKFSASTCSMDYCVFSAYSVSNYCNNHRHLLGGSSDNDSEVI